MTWSFRAAAFLNCSTPSESWLASFVCEWRRSATRGTGTFTSTSWSTETDADELKRAKQAERQLFERVVALEGSISGEHGIGFAKAPYLAIELSEEEIALMKRVKAAFDPAGILNPGQDLSLSWMVGRSSFWFKVPDSSRSN